MPPKHAYKPSRLPRTHVYMHAYVTRFLLSICLSVTFLHTLPNGNAKAHRPPIHTPHADTRHDTCHVDAPTYSCETNAGTTCETKFTDFNKLTWYELRLEVYVCPRIWQCGGENAQMYLGHGNTQIRLPRSPITQRYIHIHLQIDRRTSSILHTYTPTHVCTPVKLALDRSEIFFHLRTPPEGNKISPP